MGRNALSQKKVSEQAINVMGDTIEDMETEIEETDEKLDPLERK